MVLGQIIAIVALIMVAGFLAMAFKYLFPFLFSPQKKGDIAALLLFLLFIFVAIALVLTSFDEIKAAWAMFFLGD